MLFYEPADNAHLLDKVGSNHTLNGNEGTGVDYFSRIAQKSPIFPMEETTPRVRSKQIGKMS